MILKIGNKKYGLLFIVDHLQADAATGVCSR